MKALICTLNSKYIHSTLAPWCLFTACKAYCKEEIELHVTEGTINENQLSLTERLISENADAYAFSCYIWNIEKTLKLCEKIKAASKSIKVILGGPEVSYNQRELLTENKCLDYILSGEGEVSLPQLINNLFLGGDTDIPSLASRKGDEIIVDTRMPDTDISVSPYCKEYFDSLNGRIAYIESSRGCPFSCAFCLSGRCTGVRYIDLERVKSEMIHLSACGAKTVKFVDRTFNCNKERAGEILRFIIEHRGGAISEDTCFHFEIAADLLDEELFEIIEKLPGGSVQFEVGIQSFNESTLKAINRRTDIKRVEENVRRLVSLGSCHIHIDLIAGLPDESYESFVVGFNRAYGIGANMLQLGFLKLLRGSPMAENPERFPCEHMNTPPYEVVSTPWITSEELHKLHIAENELERIYNSGRFRRTLAYVLSKGITPYGLFLGFGEHLDSIGEKESIPLDRYTNLLFNWLSAVDGVDRMTLRNRMIHDRIATNNSGVIPEGLKISDAKLKKVKKYINEKAPQKKGTGRSVAILYGENKAVYCDYDRKHPVSGEYETHTVELSDIEG